MKRALLLILLAACGDNKVPGLEWGMGVATVSASARGITPTPAAADAPAWLATIEDNPLIDTPTYDRSDQVTHPDVLVEPDRVLLAVTPYPYSNDDYENPSLLLGSDGSSFRPFPGAPDPLVPMPPVDHNDDPDLRRLADGTYELLYLDTERPETQTLVSLRSTDLRTWTRRDAIIYHLDAGDPFIVSPAAIVDDAGVTHLFYVTLNPDHISTRISTDGVDWTSHPDSTLAIDMGDVIPWHLDVIRAGTGYAMLISGYVGAEFIHQDLYLATSPDLVTWTLQHEPLLDHDDLGVSTLYRSTAIVSGDRFVIWYAKQY